MVGFNDELAKQANSISTIGMRALESAVSGLKSTARGVKDVASATPGALGRFGQRQVHGLTGWTPQGFMNPEGIRGMRAGATDAAERLSAAERSVAPGPGKYRPGLVDRVLNRSQEQVQQSAVAAKHKEVVNARKAYQSAQKAEDMGLTSLPGYARALARNPADALRTGFAEQWHSMGPGGKALMVGLPGMGIASELSRPTEPGGPGRLERAGTRLGELSYSMGPIPLSGQLAVGAGVGSLAKRMGKLFDKTKPVGHIPAAPGLDPAGGEVAPAEHIVSDRALGIGQGGYL
jgi:hypothetical protein